MKQQHKRQARFWDWHNSSPVRIKLNPGQTLHHHQSWRDDEGPGWRGQVYEFDGETVRLEQHSGGRDCDGSYGYESYLSCSVADLNHGAVIDGVQYPDWNKSRESVYDATAEAAGY